MGLVLLVELLFDGRELTAFELGDLDRFPSVGCTDERAEHQLEDRSFAERIRDDLQTPAFLNKQTFQQIRRANGPPIVTGNRKCAMQASKSSMKQATALSC